MEGKGPVALAWRFLFVLQGDRSYYGVGASLKQALYEQTKHHRSQNVWKTQAAQGVT